MSENIRGITFAEQAVTPADDAIVRRAILGDGVLTGCNVTYSGSTLTLASGYIIACGRSFQITTAQNFAVVDATSGVARLLLTIDLTQTATEETFNQISFSIEYAAAEDGFVDLIQDDINLSGTKYQIVCAVVSLGTGGITGIVSKLEKTEGGGGGLNFKIVPGLTQPGTAAENTIWVKTEKIGVWFFSATQPENMQEWDVWFPTGTVSLVEFNALRKDALQVYPRSARQMVGGVLVEVTAMTYQNGSWQEWALWLYNRGAEKYPLRLTVQYDVTASYVKNADSITVTLEKVGSTNRVHGVYIEIPEKMDLTPYTVMKCVASRSAAAGSFILGVTNGTAAGGDFSSGMIAQNSMTWESIGTDHICTLDVSAINEMAYPVVRIYASGNTTIESSITFKEWWLE